jgi:hypothetical protein
VVHQDRVPSSFPWPQARVDKKDYHLEYRLKTVRSRNRCCYTWINCDVVCFTKEFGAILTHVHPVTGVKKWVAALLMKNLC